jgi:hypothetical protein
MKSISQMHQCCSYVTFLVYGSHGGWIFFIQNSGALARQQTIPTERPPLVGEVSANFSGWKMSRGQRNDSPRPLISVF